MKFFAAVLLFIILISFVSKKNIIAPKLTAPPETVQLKDSLYIDKLEVTNAMWRSFTESWLLEKEEDTATYKKMQPDSAVWYSLKFDYENYVKSYATSPTFSDYPVVGITYEQAIAFCEWRTERVNEYLEKIRDAKFRSVIYRLPTEAEWELAATGKLDIVKFPYGYERIKVATKYDTAKMFNCRYKDIDSARNTEQLLVAPSNSGTPNLYGIYNIIGNVGEMVSEKGLSKGGFYELAVENCKVKEKFSYKKPNRYLGFRCVCVVDNTSAFKKPKEVIKQTKQPKAEKKSKQKKGVKGFEQQEDSTIANPK
ncbi:MAG: SUMF1/EgtB/PvdO family nonheme iron enzyme [Pedobacter sp.]|nr:SUMF1/EgtB/PvdO family nonheme iron enzyme [Chitinophagaceae bacterium]